MKLWVSSCAVVLSIDYYNNVVQFDILYVIYVRCNSQSINQIVQN